MYIGKRAFALAAILWGAALACTTAKAQGATVSFHVSLEPQRPLKQKTTVPVPLTGANAVVAWLTPTGVSAGAPQHAVVPAHDFVLAQKDKQFIPHLLVIPTGSRVDFPNMDPFFHNVFSLFDGRRFDLGLYEAGSRRSVRFDHDGVSYIFCNIHPEMSAVVVSLSTPYYVVANGDGVIVLPGVPRGDYDLRFWSQNVSSVDAAAVEEHIHVSGGDLHLPPVKLRRTASPLDQHLNKFGEEYKKPDQAPYSER